MYDDKSELMAIREIRYDDEVIDLPETIYIEKSQQYPQDDLLFKVVKKLVSKWQEATMKKEIME